jgi:hypothetical protein
MLSEALQRNAEHEARLSNISVYFRWWIGPDLIRDGKPGLAPKAFGAALQLRLRSAPLRIGKTSMSILDNVF